ncbi:sigma-54 dependent transcriptional regulator [Ramlibacter sp. XY19]|uniref:sigma-54 interaction domain-containing protein n=1 Tax=Ramlibacter paludis TaxID=2908000 RepID=UPI0023DA72E3|nr:sigma-54 dependent transcriptional regulator [Ramlibacter paludis]MCG2593175.1 sigma-54 dependent transcriptional regulator [Ramlibacter paludis]
MPRTKPAVPRPGPAPRVVVCAAPAQAALAETIASFLRLEGQAAECADLDADVSGDELVVLLASAPDLAAALAQLAARRDAVDGCTVPLALPACAPSPPHPALRALVGESPAFQQQVARLPVFAKYDASVMILGDTGTGKELCAQAIHYLSARAEGPWVAVNCAAIPTELLESELFGHVKGAYTHAHAGRAGLVREAEGGTLFLDEIDSLPYESQGKLLRFLQDKAYRAVGSSALEQADVRIIAASSRRLEQLRATSTFRQDLLYRLNVLTLHMPSLRERRTDIAQLALHFLRSAAAQWQKPVPALSAAALQKLLAHDWPGNVRELKNVVERGVLMCPGGVLGPADIDLDGMPEITVADAGPESFRSAKARVVETFERGFILQLLACSGGNVTRAAQAAGKNRRAFFELMRKYSIESGDFREQA